MARWQTPVCSKFQPFWPRALLVGALLGSTSGCSQLFFHPAEQHVRTPEDIELAYQDVWLQTDDGVRLHGWFLPARYHACGTVLHLHGNAQNISTHINSVYWLPLRGFNVLMVDYRGYGRSAGKPSLDGLQTDIDAAMRYLVERQGETESAPIIIFGQSLGGSAAVTYVARSPYRSHIGALVVEAAFTGPRAIAREKLASFWLTWPFQWLANLTISDGYESLSAVEAIAPIPLLFVHGTEDSVIPVAHSERLYAAANEPKELWKVRNVGHIGAFRSDRLRDRLAGFLSKRVCPQVAQRYSK